MASTTQDLLRQGNPLGRSTSWMVVAIEAVALLILGAFVLADKAGAGTAILQITSVVLLVASLAGIITEFRAGASDLVRFTSFRAGIGVCIGAIGTASWMWAYIEFNALRLILGWGLLAYAAITVAGLLIGRKHGADSWSGLGTGVITSVLGIVLLINDDASSSGTLRLLGVVFLLGGVMLAGIAWLRFKRSQVATTRA